VGSCRSRLRSNVRNPIRSQPGPRCACAFASFGARFGIPGGFRPFPSERLGTLLDGCARGVHGGQIQAAGPSETMALPFGDASGPRDSRALAILAKTIYRELRSSGFEARDVVALAGELLGQVTSEVRLKSEVRRDAPAQLVGASPRDP